MAFSKSVGQGIPYKGAAAEKPKGREAIDRLREMREAEPKTDRESKVKTKGRKGFEGHFKKSGFYSTSDRSHWRIHSYMYFF